MGETYPWSRTIGAEFGDTVQYFSDLKAWRTSGVISLL